MLSFQSLDDDANEGTEKLAIIEALGRGGVLRLIFGTINSKWTR